MVVTAVSNRDTPVLLGVVLIAAVAYVTINLIIDLLYPVLDVRLRTAGGPFAATPKQYASQSADAIDVRAIETGRE